MSARGRRAAQLRTRRWARPLSVVAVVLVVLSLAAQTGASAAPARARGGAPQASSPVAAPTWKTVSKLNLGETPAVSCNPGACWAIGNGGLQFSGDDGQTWTSRSDLLPASVDRLDAVDCPDASTCFVAGRTEGGPVVSLRLRDDAVVQRPVPLQQVKLLSCASSVNCLAIDGTGAVATTRNGGVSWTLQSPVGAGITALSCVPGTAKCLAVGQTPKYPYRAVVQRTLTLGGSWEALTSAQADWRGFGSIDCPSVRLCLTAASDLHPRQNADVAATQDVGVTWQARPTGAPAVRALQQSLSCVTASHCTIVGVAYDAGGAPGDLVVAHTTDGGLTWASTVLPGRFDTAAVSCASESSCAIVTPSAVGYATQDGGATWQQTALSRAVSGPFPATSCPTGDHCVALTQVGGETAALTSDDAGVTWAVHALPPGADGVSPGYLTCPTASSCVASLHDGFTGRIIASTDGGVTWTLNGSDAVQPLEDAHIACRTAMRCLAFGGRRGAPAAARTTDGGQTWRAIPTPRTSVLLQGASCSADSCVVIGVAARSDGLKVLFAWTTTDFGTTFVRRVLPDDGGQYGFFGGVDCTSGSTCVAAGELGEFTSNAAGFIIRSTDGGATWTTVKPAGTRNLYLSDVSCGNTTTCLVAGNGNGAPAEVLFGSADAGLSWGKIITPATGNTIFGSIACPPVGTRCISADVGVTGVVRVIAGQVR